MPSAQTVIVDTTGGGDYTSLAAAEAATRQNLVAGDKVITFKCRGGADTSAVAFNSANWTTDTTRYVVIEADTGHEALDTGWSTSRYRLAPSNVASGSLLTSQVHMLIDKLQIGVTGQTNASTAVILTQTATTTITRSRIRGVMSGGSINGIFSDSGKLQTVNNYIHGFSSATTAGIQAYGCTDSVIYANTCYGNYRNIWTRFCTRPKGKNNLCAAPVDVDYKQDVAWNASANNASSDTTASGTGALTSRTFTFEASGSGDFRLASGDTGAQDAGANLSSDGLYAVTTDFAGTSRGATPEVGAFEFAGASTFRRVYY